MITRRRIDFDKYQTEQPQSVGGGLLSGGAVEAMASSKKLHEVISLVKQNSTLFWVSNGDWSMHELLLSLLNITGPASVYLSSYAMSETPARVLAQLKADKMIRSLHCVLDNRIDVRTAGSYQLMKSISNQLVLVDTHAKVTVITNENWHIAVVGSANYTENKRYEAGIITTDTDAVTMQLNWITKALIDGSN